jgi:DNA adenine methylase
MRYLGGKTQIAKELAAVLNAERGALPFWDPFCGSLAVSKALGGAGLCSDISLPLISLYEAIARGWRPPTEMSKAEWQAAKNLPDTDPLKGFAGFGCSFRGLYFSGYAGGYVGPCSNPGALAAAKVLVRDVTLLKARGCDFICADFFDCEPEPGYFVYLDPPYRDTSKYDGTPPINYDLFYARVEAWARFGPVFVSEYSFPLGRCIWEKSRAIKLRAGSGERATERLFRVGAAA